LNVGLKVAKTVTDKANVKLKTRSAAMTNSSVQISACFTSVTGVLLHKQQSSAASGK